jgi:hypothetical protein
MFTPRHPTLKGLPMNISHISQLKPTFRDLYYQAEELLKQGKVVDASVEIYHRKRTIPQNKYLWAVYKNIVLFWTDTGFVPDGLQVRFINSDFLHKYFSARFDVHTTTKFNTVEMMEYVDKIQQLMIEQTKGEYEPIIPEERNENE